MALVESFNPDAQTQQTSGGSQSTDQLTQEQVDADIEALYQAMEQ